MLHSLNRSLVLLLHLLSSILLSRMNQLSKYRPYNLHRSPYTSSHPASTLTSLFASHTPSHLGGSVLDHKRKTGLSIFLGLLVIKEDYTKMGARLLPKKKNLSSRNLNMCGRSMLAEGIRSSEVIRHAFNDNRYRYKTDMTMSFNKSCHCLPGASDLQVVHKEKL